MRSTTVQRPVDELAWRHWFWPLVALHLVFWTMEPILAQPNVSLDTAEMVAWGHEWQWGYAKHPPLPAWLAEAAHRAGGGAAGGGWLIYLLCQIAVGASFWAVWRLATQVVRPHLAILSVLLLETTSFYSWVMREWNNNVAVLPFMALSVLSFHQALRNGRLRHWFALGLALGFGVLSKYVIGLLGVSMALFILAHPRARRTAGRAGPCLAIAVLVLILLPHLLWVIDHRFTTLAYAIRRAPPGGALGRLLHPPVFLLGQAAYLGFFFGALMAVLAWPVRLRCLTEDERLVRDSLVAVVFGPCALVVLFSLLTGRQLVTAWGIPFWSFLGLLAVFCLETTRDSGRVRRAAALCVVFASINLVGALGVDLLRPLALGKETRGHFPGRTLAEQVANAWNRRFDAPLVRVGGERWLAHNVGFYSPQRPSVFESRGLWTSELDLAANPWTSIEDFSRRGGVLLWYADREGPGLPASLGQHFPTAEVLAPLTVRWQTSAPLPPVRVGLALVAPGTAVRLFGVGAHPLVGLDTYTDV